MCLTWSLCRVNVACFISGPGLRLPADRRGSTWTGLAHVRSSDFAFISMTTGRSSATSICILLFSAHSTSRRFHNKIMEQVSDWYETLVVGVAGGKAVDLRDGKTGPREPDSYNLWPSLFANGTVPSPRVEVVHQVNNSYYSEGVQSLRWQQYKLIRSSIKGGPGDSRIISWPAPAPAPVQFGLSGGTIGKDVWPAGPHKVDHCRSSIGKRASGTLDCKPFCLFDLEAVSLVPFKSVCQMSLHANAQHDCERQNV
eukprot:COSAG02_NODE_8789_length_2444_cov_1.818337_2_plen_255_part_00